MSRYIGLKLDFDNIAVVSATGEPDKLNIALLDASLLASKETGVTLKYENVHAMYCDDADEGVTCATIPALITEERKEEIEDLANPIDDAIKAVTQGNVFVSILLSATAAELFGALKHF